VMFVNLLLFLAEVVTEFRSATMHTVHIRFYFQGLGEQMQVVPWAWLGAACNVTAFFLLLTPKTRMNHITLNFGCLLIIVGVFIEKGIGLVLPGLTPGTLGEVYAYDPSLVEVMISIGIAGIGAFIFTIFSKIAVPIAFRRPYEEDRETIEEGLETLPKVSVSDLPRIL